MKRDGHVHSLYCPHGTTDLFENYIEIAIQKGIQQLTFTEHAPAPTGFVDTVPTKDSFMNEDDLPEYFHTIQQLKTKYASQIQLFAGLEVDYIEGYEEQTTAFLSQWGSQLDDAILSVHFLKWQNEYVCIDFSSDLFTQFAKQVGSISAVYDLYYQTVQRSIRSNLGPYKPKRIGHMTLVHKFQLSFHETIDDWQQMKETIDLAKTFQMELDVNSAGLAKKDCQEIYPPPKAIEYAKNSHVPLVFGSDAHQAKDLHQFEEDVYTLL